MNTVHSIIKYLFSANNMPVTILNMGYREQQRMRWLDGINGHELGQTLGDGEGPGSLVCCSPWGYKESDTTW